MVVGKTNSRNILLRFPLSFMLTTLLFLRSSTLTMQLESLQLAANMAVDAINAWGSLINARLNDILAHIQEIALHDVRHGAAVMLTAARV